MNHDDLPLPHDATPSWNGYNYQGLVAIYIGVKALCEVAESDWDDYKLELEWIGDFSIKKLNRYVSVHEVKSHQQLSISQYVKILKSILYRFDKRIKETVFRDDLPPKQAIELYKALVDGNIISESGYIKSILIYKLDNSSENLLKEHRSTIINRLTPYRRVRAKAVPDIYLHTAVPMNKKWREILDRLYKTM